MNRGTLGMMLGRHANAWGGVAGHPVGVTRTKDLFYLTPGDELWGLPVARITHRAHPNDLAQSRLPADRNADILEAAGARRVRPVHADRITGNCSHQHGTARIGDDPDDLVLDSPCRAHEVGNLYVIDGSPFPTATGINPTLTTMADAWRVAEDVGSARPAAAARATGT